MSQAWTCFNCKRFLKHTSSCLSCGERICRRCQIGHFIDFHEADEDQKHMMEIGGQ